MKPSAAVYTGLATAPIDAVGVARGERARRVTAGLTRAPPAPAAAAAWAMCPIYDDVQSLMSGWYVFVAAVLLGWAALVRWGFCRTWAQAVLASGTADDAGPSPPCFVPG